MIGAAEQGVQTAVKPGMRLPEFSRLVTQEVIDAYAEASGDFNPIHTDPEYAASGPFGKTIAHGMMTLAYASELMTRWGGEAWLTASAIDVAFLGPVFAGDTVTATGMVKEISREDEGDFAVCELTCHAGDRLVMAGTSRCRIVGN